MERGGTVARPGAAGATAGAVAVGLAGAGICGGGLAHGAGLVAVFPVTRPGAREDTVMWTGRVQRVHLSPGSGYTACGRRLIPGRLRVDPQHRGRVTCKRCLRYRVRYDTIHERDGHRLRALCGLRYDVARHLFSDWMEDLATCGTCLAVLARRWERRHPTRVMPCGKPWTWRVHWATPTSTRDGWTACGVRLVPDVPTTPARDAATCKRCRLRRRALPGWRRARRAALDAAVGRSPRPRGRRGWRQARFRWLAAQGVNVAPSLLTQAARDAARRARLAGPRAQSAFVATLPRVQYNTLSKEVTHRVDSDATKFG